MLTYDAFHLSVGPLHLLLHARDLSLDRAKLSLGLLELGLKISYLTFECCNLILKLSLPRFLTVDGLLMTLLQPLDIPCMVLLFLGQLTVKVAVKLCNKLLVRCLQLFDLLGMLGLQAIDFC